MADYARQHALGKYQLYQKIQATRADRDPGDGVYRIRPLIESTVMVGHTMVTLRTSVAYDDPHMISLITENEIPYRVVSESKHERELVPVLAKRKEKPKAMPLP